MPPENWPIGVLRDAVENARVNVEKDPEAGSMVGGGAIAMESAVRGGAVVVGDAVGPFPGGTFASAEKYSVGKAATGDGKVNWDSEAASRGLPVGGGPIGRLMDARRPIGPVFVTGAQRSQRHYEAAFDLFIASQLDLLRFR